jgi:general stress protein 26
MTTAKKTFALTRLIVCSAIAVATASGQGGLEPKRAAALDIMKEARYATLVTLGIDGQPQARIVDPLLSPSVGSIWIATNPLSRKIREIQRNPRVTLLFFNTPKNEFVTVLARATVVTDSAAKAKHWKPEWTPFYKGGSNGGTVTLFEVKPFQLEIVSPARGFENDTITWRPVIVRVP